VEERGAYLKGKQMKVDFSQVLVGLDGKPMQLQTAPDRVEPMTLGRVAIEALLTPNENDKDGATKLARFNVALRINDARAPMDMSPEDAATLKALIGAMYPPLIVGRTFEILNG